MIATAVQQRRTTKLVLGAPLVIVSAAILFIFGTGPVRGFATTLVFGLLANLFTAVFVSRFIFDFGLDRKERGEALSI